MSIQLIKREQQADGNFNNGEILKKTNWVSSRWRYNQAIFKFILLGSCMDTR